MLDNKYKFSLVFVWIDQRGKDQAKPEFQPNVTQTLKITGGMSSAKYSLLEMEECTNIIYMKV